MATHSAGAQAARSSALLETLAVRDSWLSVLKPLGEASAIFVALTFVGGWSYLASYYKTFGLNPIELDIPVPVASTIAIYLLYESVWPLIIGGLLIVLLAFAARRIGKFGSGTVAAVFVLLLLISATAGVVRGRQVANQDMLVDSPNLPNVAFASKVKNPEPSCVDFETYGSSDCKLLLHLKNVYYFFQPVPRAGIGNLNLYMISDSELVGAHIQRGLSRNSGRE